MSVTASPPPIAQNADIRYLGKLLGDVIRAYGGEALFERIERIRATSVSRHRGTTDAEALNLDLDALSLDDTLSFVRSFMLFSMLANLAEDRQASAARAGRTCRVSWAGWRRREPRSTTSMHCSTRR